MASSNLKKKIRVRATGGIVFLATTKWCIEKSSLRSSDSKLKNNSPKYEKNEKLTFEIWIWVKKPQACATDCELRNGYNQKLCREDFFKLEGFRIEMKNPRFKISI